MDGGIQVDVPDEAYFKRLIKCQNACPVHTDARGYVRAIAQGDPEKAYLIARGPNPLASICGRVCGAPCEAACRRGDIDQSISIRALKRFVTERFGSESGRFEPLDLLRRAAGGAARDCSDQEELGALGNVALERVLQSLDRPPPEGPRVAIIGSGPAGLAAAHDLALLGFRPTVFEMEPVPAGMLAVGIPAYRLPRELIRAEVALIEALGVEFRCNTQVGKEISFEEIRREFQAAVIAVGAKRSRQLPLPGADGPGVIGGIEFLRDVSLDRPVTMGRRVVVIGGGNVAYDVARSVVRQSEMDVSRTALRLAGVRDVHMVSLESLEEMPADDLEIIEGDEEGVHRHHRLGPREILRDGSGAVRGVAFNRVLRVFDDEGRFSPVFDQDETVTIEADTVLWAIGQRPDLSFLPPEGDVGVNEHGYVDHPRDQVTTGAPDVFVAGDIATGPRLLIHAVASGKHAAREVARFLTGKTLRQEQVVAHRVIEPYGREADYEKHSRVPVPSQDAERRLSSNSELVELGYSPHDACLEAARCLDCGINTIFDSEKCILCGGCADICPELCLRLVSVKSLEGNEGLERLVEERYGSASKEDGGLENASAIIKDETRCIRCGLCARRCPVGAITMERMRFQSVWQEQET